MSATEKLKAEYEKKLAQAQAEDALNAAVPESVKPLLRHVHIYELYGRVGSLDFGDSYHHDKKLTWQQVIELSDAFPAVPLVEVRDSCLSFRTRRHVDSLPEADKERWQSETDLAPFKVTIERDGCKVEWNTEINGQIVEVDCSCRIPRHLGRTTGRRVEYMGGVRYKDRGFIISDDFQRIERDGEPLCETQSARAISFWSPDDHPGQYVIVWVPIQAEKQATPADLARQIIRFEEAK